MVSARTMAHDEPNMDGIKRPIFVAILVAGDVIAKSSQQWIASGLLIAFELLNRGDFKPTTDRTQRSLAKKIACLDRGVWTGGTGTTGSLNDPMVLN